MAKLMYLVLVCSCLLLAGEGVNSERSLKFGVGLDHDHGSSSLIDQTGQLNPWPVNRATVGENIQRRDHKLVDGTDSSATSFLFGNNPKGPSTLKASFEGKTQFEEGKSLHVETNPDSKTKVIPVTISRISGNTKLQGKTIETDKGSEQGKSVSSINKQSKSVFSTWSSGTPAVELNVNHATKNLAEEGKGNKFTSDVKNFSKGRAQFGSNFGPEFSVTKTEISQSFSNNKGAGLVGQQDSKHGTASFGFVKTTDTGLSTDREGKSVSSIKTESKSTSGAWSLDTAVELKGKAKTKEFSGENESNEFTSEVNGYPREGRKQFSLSITPEYSVKTTETSQSFSDNKGAGLVGQLDSKHGTASFGFVKSTITGFPTDREGKSIGSINTESKSTSGAWVSGTPAVEFKDKAETKEFAGENESNKFTSEVNGYAREGRAQFGLSTTPEYSEKTTGISQSFSDNKGAGVVEQLDSKHGTVSFGFVKSTDTGFPNDREGKSVGSINTESKSTSGAWSFGTPAVEFKGKAEIKEISGENESNKFTSEVNGYAREGRAQFVLSTTPEWSGKTTGTSQSFSDNKGAGLVEQLDSKHGTTSFGFVKSTDTGFHTDREGKSVGSINTDSKSTSGAWSFGTPAVELKGKAETKEFSGENERNKFTSEVSGYAREGRAQFGLSTTPEYSVKTTETSQSFSDNQEAGLVGQLDSKHGTTSFGFVKSTDTGFPNDREGKSVGSINTESKSTPDAWSFGTPAVEFKGKAKTKEFSGENERNKFTSEVNGYSRGGRAQFGLGTAPEYSGKTTGTIQNFSDKKGAGLVGQLDSKHGTTSFGFVKSSDTGFPTDREGKSVGSINTDSKSTSGAWSFGIPAVEFKGKAETKEFSGENERNKFTSKVNGYSREGRAQFGLGSAPEYSGKTTETSQSFSDNKGADLVGQLDSKHGTASFGFVKSTDTGFPTDREGKSVVSINTESKSTSGAWSFGTPAVEFKGKAETKEFSGENESNEFTSEVNGYPREGRTQFGLSTTPEYSGKTTGTSQSFSDNKGAGLVEQLDSKHGTVSFEFVKSTDTGIPNDREGKSVGSINTESKSTLGAWSFGTPAVEFKGKAETKEISGENESNKFTSEVNGYAREGRAQFGLSTTPEYSGKTTGISQSFSDNKGPGLVEQLDSKHGTVSFGFVKSTDTGFPNDREGKSVGSINTDSKSTSGAWSFGTPAVEFKGKAETKEISGENESNKFTSEVNGYAREGRAQFGLSTTPEYSEKTTGTSQSFSDNKGAGLVEQLDSKHGTTSFGFVKSTDTGFYTDREGKSVGSINTDSKSTSGAWSFGTPAVELKGKAETKEFSGENESNKFTSEVNEYSRGGRAQFGLGAAPEYSGKTTGTIQNFSDNKGAGLVGQLDSTHGTTSFGIVKSTDTGFPTDREGKSVGSINADSKSTSGAWSFGTPAVEFKGKAETKEFSEENESNKFTSEVNGYPREGHAQFGLSTTPKYSVKTTETSQSFSDNKGAGLVGQLDSKHGTTSFGYVKSTDTGFPNEREGKSVGSINTDSKSTSGAWSFGTPAVEFKGKAETKEFSGENESNKFTSEVNGYAREGRAQFGLSTAPEYSVKTTETSQSFSDNKGAGLVGQLDSKHGTTSFGFVKSTDSRFPNDREGKSVGSINTESKSTSGAWSFGIPAVEFKGKAETKEFSGENERNKFTSKVNGYSREGRAQFGLGSAPEYSGKTTETSQSFSDNKGADLVGQLDSKHGTASFGFVKSTDTGFPTDREGKSVVSINAESKLTSGAWSDGTPAVEFKGKAETKEFAGENESNKFTSEVNGYAREGRAQFGLSTTPEYSVKTTETSQSFSDNKGAGLVGQLDSKHGTTSFGFVKSTDTGFPNDREGKSVGSINTESKSTSGAWSFGTPAVEFKGNAKTKEFSGENERNKFTSDVNGYSREGRAQFGVGTAPEYSGKTTGTSQSFSDKKGAGLVGQLDSKHGTTSFGFVKSTDTGFPTDREGKSVVSINAESKLTSGAWSDGTPAVEFKGKAETKEFAGENESNKFTSEVNGYSRGGRAQFGLGAAPEFTVQTTGTSQSFSDNKGTGFVTKLDTTEGAAGKFGYFSSNREGKAKAVVSPGPKSTGSNWSSLTGSLLSSGPLSFEGSASAGFDGTATNGFPVGR